MGRGRANLRPIVLAVLLASAILPPSAAAQEEEVVELGWDADVVVGEGPQGSHQVIVVPRGEIGLFYEYQRDVDSHLNLHGYGAPITGNVNRWFAVETTLSLDPKRGAVPVRFLHQEFAAKLTYRQGRGAVFGFVGPGYVNARAFGFSDTRPTLKWGGGVEYYPKRHVGLRVDAGHLIVFFPGDRTGNFFLQSGISFRF